jgi:hypothetical protein
MVASFICLTFANIYFRLGIVAFAIGWAMLGMKIFSCIFFTSLFRFSLFSIVRSNIYMLASIGFFAGAVPDGRRALALYPVVLFYIVIGWMIILGTFPEEPTLAPTLAPISISPSSVTI